jgi:hypothetical protein
MPKRDCSATATHSSFIDQLLLGGEGRNRPGNATFRGQIDPIGRTDQLISVAANRI